VERHDNVTLRPMYSVMNIMAQYCIIGYLDEFVKPSPEGWEIQAPILSWMNADKNLSHTQVWQKIQDDEGLSPIVKALEKEHIRLIMEWMVEMNLIGKPETQTITYSLEV